MSEFRCQNDHLMRSGEYVCKICGGYLETVDGETSGQFRRREKAERDSVARAEDDEEEDEK